MVAVDTPVMVQDARAFWQGASGRWAGEQWLAAIKRGEIPSAAHLRTADTLRKDQWIELDNVLVEENMTRIRGVQDLLDNGLVKRIPNGLGRTVLQYEKISDMNPANVSMDGMTRGENDRPDFTLAGIPLPITHKDFFFNIRTLAASRRFGEPLDDTAVRVAGRKIAEAREDMLFNGGKQFASLPIYGYTTHPNRNLETLGANWASATAAQILSDVGSMLSTLQSDRFYGPYVLYVPGNASVNLNADYSTSYTRTIRQRILDYPEIQDVRVSDALATGNVVLVQMTSDVVQMVEGEPLQTVQWDIEGGMGVNFKAFEIMVPLIKASSEGRSGIVHGS